MAVVIADDQDRERGWLKDLMSTNHRDLMPILEARNGLEAVELVGAHRPKLVFLDLEMPHLSGIKATAKILEVSPQTGIVIVSNHANEIWVRQLWKMMPNDGAFAYVLKESSDNQILDATRSVIAGDCWVHPKIQRVLLKASSNTTLTSGEFEVLGYICLGLTDKAIAHRLYLTEKAVQARLKAVYTKMGIPLRGSCEENEFNLRSRAINLALRQKLINVAQLDEWEATLRIDL